MSKTTKVVVGIVINENDKSLLIAKRQHGKELAGFWEFPGGKVEKEEQPLEALKRELYEEIGIMLTEAMLFTTKQHQYNDKVIDLAFFIVSAFEGTPYAKEGQALKEVGFDELHDFPMLEANKEIIDLLCQRYKVS